MFKFWKCFIYYILYSFTLKFGNAIDNSQLVSTIVVFRHGDRTPISTYPNDPYVNHTQTDKLGQLTNEGKIKLFKLGQWYRQRYDGLLADTYEEREIYVFSTELERNILSAQITLAGLYAPRNKQVRRKNPDWQSVPINTAPLYEELIISMLKQCEQYNVLLNNLFRSPKFVQMRRELNELERNLSLSRSSRMTMESVFAVAIVYDTLTWQKSQNLTLPAWTESVYPDKLLRWTHLYYALPAYNQELARFKAGPFLHEAIEHFRNISNNAQNDYKMKMYAAHDTTIANIFSAMKMFDYHIPPAGSTILFELKRLESDFFINIVYRNGTTLYNLTLPGCDFNCPLDKFAKLLEPVSLSAKEWEHECNKEHLQVTTLPNTQNISLIICATISFLAIIGYLIVRIKQKQFNCEDNHAAT